MSRRKNRHAKGLGKQVPVYFQLVLPGTSQCAKSFDGLMRSENYGVSAKVYNSGAGLCTVGSSRPGSPYVGPPSRRRESADSGS